MTRTEDFENNLDLVTTVIQATTWGKYDLEVVYTKDAWGNPELIIVTDIGSDEPWPVTVFEAEDNVEALWSFIGEVSGIHDDAELNEFIADQISQRATEEADKYRPRSARVVADQIQARA